MLVKKEACIGLPLHPHIWKDKQNKIGFFLLSRDDEMEIDMSRMRMSTQKLFYYNHNPLE